MLPTPAQHRQTYTGNQFSIIIPLDYHYLTTPYHAINITNTVKLGILHFVQCFFLVEGDLDIITSSRLGSQDSDGVKYNASARNHFSSLCHNSPGSYEYETHSEVVRSITNRSCPSQEMHGHSPTLSGSDLKY